MIYKFRFLSRKSETRYALHPNPDAEKIGIGWRWMMCGDLTYEMRINQSKLRVLWHTSSTQGTTNFLIFTENQNIINKYSKCQENIKKMSIWNKRQSSWKWPKLERYFHGGSHLKVVMSIIRNPLEYKYGNLNCSFFLCDQSHAIFWKYRAPNRNDSLNYYLVMV